MEPNANDSASRQDNHVLFNTSLIQLTLKGEESQVLDIGPILEEEPKTQEIKRQYKSK